MGKIKDSQQGFSAVESVLVVVIVVLIGAVGWLVYKNYHKATAASSSSTSSSTKANPITSTTTKTATKDPYAGWSTYISKAGGFTLRYPSGWILQGHTGTYGTTTVPASQMDGTENSFDIASTTAKTNAFYVWFDLGSSPNSLSSINAPLTQIPYAQGSIINNLPNGIGVWQAGRSLTINGHVNDDAYPPSETASNGQFGFKLNNGKYLDATMSFMVGAHGSGINTTYSYDQQINSPEYNQGINILASVAQN